MAPGSQSKVTSRRFAWIEEKFAFKETPAMTSRRAILAAMLAAGMGVMVAAPTFAQTFPNRPIKIIVPFAPGGADVMARLVADRLSASLGQPVIIENRPGGAGGTVGTKAVTTADPDGYTLTLASPGPITVAPAVYKNLDYDPVRQLAPIGMIATSPFVLVVHPDVPAKSVAEFVAYSKANPGKVNFVSPGFGTSSHLFGELLKLRTGAEILHVPYRGATPAIADLVAGQVQMFFDNIRNLQPFIQSGKLRALAVTGENRHPEMPELPTMIESGIDGFFGYYWNGLLAPAGTPQPIIDRLNAILNEGLRSDMRATVVRLGMEPKFGTPQDFAKFMADETQRWIAVARAANL
jgi:tripartite-type tricarboxylate transporter receptor subunit TctC